MYMMHQSQPVEDNIFLFSQPFYYYYRLFIVVSCDVTPAQLRNLFKRQTFNFVCMSNMRVRVCERTPKVGKVLCVVCRSLIAYGLKAVQLLAVRLYFL